MKGVEDFEKFCRLLVGGSWLNPGSIRGSGKFPFVGLAGEYDRPSLGDRLSYTIYNSFHLVFALKTTAMGESPAGVG